MAATFDTAELALLTALSRSYPSPAAALAELAGQRAGLQLPAPTVHIISDVHGEYAKLRHVINNASGALRPAVAALAGGALAEADQRDLLAVIYYPGEVLAARKDAIARDRAAWVTRTLRLQFELVRSLARAWRREQLRALLPLEFRELFNELLWEPLGLRSAAYFEQLLTTFRTHDRDLAAVRAASRLIRNLATSEILVAGDLGDRGPRIDKVIDLLMQQPPPQTGTECPGGVNIVWGNHDAHWMGACLGHGASICSVLRFSLRYRRLAQLEEGYGIVLTDLEHLAANVYGDDPAAAFVVKGTGTRDDLLLARMQKAIAIIGLKLEGQLIARHPEWNLGGRDLLREIDYQSGTIALAGNAGSQTHPLLDTLLPTIDPANPNALSPEEEACMKALRATFIASPRLWEHMSFIVRRGAMWARRDDLLIFHACVPVDTAGKPLPMVVAGKALAGRELFDALGVAVRRAFKTGSDTPETDLDLFWYLWCGALSPLFGKDKIATFESYFVADKDAKHESKNPYFELINDADFVKQLGALFGVEDLDNLLIVNGHVPVKIEKGEKPLKRGGNAVTIDGAFSEAYGDHGYSLLLTPAGVSLAEHAHFDSVQAVIASGKDMIPTTTTLRTYSPPRRRLDTLAGQATATRLAELERLLLAYEEGVLPSAGA